MRIVMLCTTGSRYKLASALTQKHMYGIRLGFIVISL